MARRSRLGFTQVVVIGVLAMLVCIGLGVLYVGYVGGDSGATTTVIGYVAMGLGLLAAILLVVGLALLILNDKRSD